MVFVDRDAGVVIPVDWDLERLDIGAKYSVECFPMAVVRIFDLDQREEDYCSDS